MESCVIVLFWGCLFIGAAAVLAVFWAGASFGWVVLVPVAAVDRGVVMVCSGTSRPRWTRGGGHAGLKVLGGLLVAKTSGRGGVMARAWMGLPGCWWLVAGQRIVVVGRGIGEGGWIGGVDEGGGRKLDGRWAESGSRGVLVWGCVSGWLSEFGVC